MSSDMQRYAHMMEHEFPRQYGFAINRTLSTIANDSRDNFRRKVAHQIFDTKNKYIQSIVENENARGVNVDTMFSRFGEMERKFGKETAAQLGIHETGGTITPGSKRKRLHDATKAGRGGSFRKPLRKKIATSKRLTTKDIQPWNNRGYFPKTERGRTIGLIAYAKRIKFKGVIVIKSPTRKVFGEYLLKGGKNKLKLVLVKNLETKTRQVKATHWMEKSYKTPISVSGEIYEHNMNKQIAHLKSINQL